MNPYWSDVPKQTPRFRYGQDFLCCGARMKSSFDDTGAIYKCGKCNYNMPRLRRLGDIKKEKL